jgi:hypothetical protein
LCLTSLKALKGFATLVWGELGGPSKLDATGLRPPTALPCSGLDQLALELSQTAEDHQH